jgi:hypothetical protein
MSDLPKNWDVLSLGALWDALNHPSRFATPQSVVDTIVYSVRARGIAALGEPNIKERLANCDEAAMKQIRDRIDGMRAKGLLP